MSLAEQHSRPAQESTLHLACWRSFTGRLKGSFSEWRAEKSNESTKQGKVCDSRGDGSHYVRSTREIECAGSRDASRFGGCGDASGTIAPGSSDCTGSGRRKSVLRRCGYSRLDSALATRDVVGVGTAGPSDFRAARARKAAGYLRDPRLCIWRGS